MWRNRDLCPRCARDWGLQEEMTIGLSPGTKCQDCEAAGAHRFRVAFDVDRAWLHVSHPFPVCESCQKAEADAFDSDPYASDIYDDWRPHWLCNECAHESAMDV